MGINCSLFAAGQGPKSRGSSPQPAQMNGCPRSPRFSAAQDDRVEEAQVFPPVVGRGDRIVSDTEKQAIRALWTGVKQEMDGRNIGDQYKWGGVIRFNEPWAIGFTFGADKGIWVMLEDIEGQGPGFLYKDGTQELNGFFEDAAAMGPLIEALRNLGS